MLVCDQKLWPKFHLKICTSTKKKPFKRENVKNFLYFQFSDEFFYFFPNFRKSEFGGLEKQEIKLWPKIRIKFLFQHHLLIHVIHINVHMVSTRGRFRVSLPLPFQLHLVIFSSLLFNTPLLF